MQHSDNGIFDSMSSMFGSATTPTWVERYARIRSGRSLVYYEYSTVDGQINAKKLGSISLRRIKALDTDARPLAADQARAHCFQLTVEPTEGADVEKFMFSAESAESKAAWVAQLSGHINMLQTKA